MTAPQQSGTGRPAFPLAWGPGGLDTGGRPLVMAVLNVTPDSFYDGGRWVDPAAAVERGLQMLDDGADMVDVGGESTRPGSHPVDSSEELERVVPVIEALHRRVPQALISVDTNKAEVADAALDAGAAVINDISGLTFDPSMAALAARRDAGLVLMHIRRRPAEMQRDPAYADVVEDVAAFLTDALSRALAAGVDEERIALDPGIGFGKTLEHNLALINRLDRLHRLGRPVLAGLSRKSFIGALLGNEPGARLAGSLGAAVAAAVHGAHLLRVHDVKETVEALKVAEAIAAGTAPDSGER